MGVAEWLRKCCAQYDLTAHHAISTVNGTCEHQSFGPPDSDSWPACRSIGFAAMTVWWSWSNGTSFDYFIQDVFMGSALYKDSILTISVLFNVGVFWMALRADWDRFARGVLGVIFITVPLIIWLQAQAF